MTDIKNIAANVLDLVFARDFSTVSMCEAPTAVTDVNKTDQYHLPLHITITGEMINSGGREEIKIFCFERGNYARLKQRLESINFAHEFRYRNMDYAMNFFCTTLNRLTIENVAQIRITAYHNKPKWWTHELQTKKNCKDKLSKQNPRGAFTAKYIQALKEFQELHSILCKEDIQRKKRNFKANPKDFWKYGRVNKTNANYPSSMYYNSEKADSPEQIVELCAALRKYLRSRRRSNEFR